MTVFIQQGDEPLTTRQATKRGLQIVENELFLAGARPGDRDILAAMAHEGLPPRLQAVVAALGAASYADYAAAWEADNATNGANNLFNHQLSACRAARARLARYRLAEGQAEIVDGGLVLQPAIAPLPVEIEQPVIDEETGAVSATQMVPNPEVVADDTERAAASALIAAASPALLAALADLGPWPGDLPDAMAPIPQPPAGAGWVWSGTRWVIDLNSASTAVLQTLAGVGATLASAILAARPLRSPSQLDTLSGISAAMVEGWTADPGLTALQTGA